MFANIPNELSSSTGSAGKVLVERYSPVCVQVGTVGVNDGLTVQVSDHVVLVSPRVLFCTECSRAVFSAWC